MIILWLLKGQMLASLEACSSTDFETGKHCYLKENMNVIIKVEG